MLHFDAAPMEAAKKAGHRRSPSPPHSTRQVRSGHPNYGKFSAEPAGVGARSSYCSARIPYGLKIARQPEYSLTRLFVRHAPTRRHRKLKMTNAFIPAGLARYRTSSTNIIMTNARHRGSAIYIPRFKWLH
jgi:hypothetical protein